MQNLEAADPIQAAQEQFNNAVATGALIAKSLSDGLQNSFQLGLNQATNALQTGLGAVGKRK